MTVEACYPNFYICLPAIETHIGLIIAGHNVVLFALTVVWFVFRIQKKIKTVSQLKPGQEVFRAAEFLHSLV